MTELTPRPPLVSIIVPTYQREEPLCNTIADLLAQDYPNRELLIVDQSPSHCPSTSRYLRSIANQAKYFQLRQPNLPAARNFGVRQSKGDIIVFFDDDMVIGQNVLNNLVKTYATSEVWGATGFLTSPGVPPESKHTPYSKFVSNISEFESKEKIRIDGFNGCFMSFRKEIFERIGYFDELIGTQPIAAGEDIEFCQRATVGGYGLFLNPAITVFHACAPSGGCGRRASPDELVQEVQLRLWIYSALKNKRYPGVWGSVDAAIQCYRHAILNRGLLRGKLPSLAQKHRTFKKAWFEAVALLELSSVRGGRCPDIKLHADDIH